MCSPKPTTKIEKVRTQERLCASHSHDVTKEPPLRVKLLVRGVKGDEKCDTLFPFSKLSFYL